MADRPSLGASIPLLRRIRRYSRSATIFRTHDLRQDNRAVGDFSNRGQSLDGSQLGAVQATLLPNDTQLPLGMLLTPQSADSQPARIPFRELPIPRDVQDLPAAPVPSPGRPAPVVQREATGHDQPISSSEDLETRTADVSQRASIPQTAPSSEAPVVSHDPSLAQAAPSEPAQVAEGESKISEADWARLRAVMRGHQEKLAREKESPEYIQRQKEKAEQEAARKAKEAELARRQDLARAGKLPPARVVYVSPDEQAAVPLMESTPEMTGEAQSKADQPGSPAESEISGTASQDPARRDKSMPEVGKKPTGTTPITEQKPKQAEKPMPLPEPEAEYKKPPSTAREAVDSVKHAEVEVSPEMKSAAPELRPAQPPDVPEFEVQQERKPSDRSAAEQYERSVTESGVQQAEPVRSERVQATKGERSSMEQAAPIRSTAPEPGLIESAQSPSAESVQVQPVKQVETQAPPQESADQAEEEPGKGGSSSIGQRLAGAIRSLFRRESESASPAEERAVESSAEPLSREKDGDDSYRPPNYDKAPEIGEPHITEQRESIAEDKAVIETMQVPSSADEAPDEPSASTTSSSRRLDQRDAVIPEKSVEPASQQPVKQTRLETTRPPAQEEEQRSEKKVEFTEGGQAIEVGQPEPSEFLTSPDDAGTLSEISRETFDRTVETETTDLMGSPSAPDVKAPIGSRSETKTPSATVQADASPRALEAPRKPENVDRDGGSTAEPFAERDVESLDPGGLQSKTLSDADEVIDLTEPEAEIEVEVEAGGADVQDRPLHEVWPVKETAQTPKRTVSTETAVEPAKLMPADDKGDQPTLIISAPELDEGTKEDELSTALRNVSPGQPTESSIELLPPRRPRPAIAPAPNQQRSESEFIEKLPSESPEEGQETSGIKQLATIDQIDTGSSQGPPQPLPRVEESTPSQPPAQEAIEQQTSFSPPTEPDTSEGKGPEMVQTGVGSLPRDFWEYLGEEAPEPSTAPPTPTPPSSTLSLSTAPETQSQSRQKPAVMSAPAALQTSTRMSRTKRPEENLHHGETRSETSTPILDFQTPLQPSGLESVLDWVQRQDGSSTTSDAGGSEDSQDQDDGTGTAELNIEELARRILPIIKRRLSIEWERNRGRF